MLEWMNPLLTIEEMDRLVGALDELQHALERTSHTATGDEQMSLPVGTVMVLAHVLLRHQA